MPQPTRPTNGPGASGRVRSGGVARAHGWARTALQRALTSPPERAEAALEARLVTARPISRCATVAVASSKGGVGKTTCAYVTGTLLADRGRLRTLIIDADPDPGTAALLVADRARSTRCATDLVADLDTIDSAAQLRAYVALDRSGLHVLAGPVEEQTFGALLHLCQRFYDIVLIDLGTGLAGPLARCARQRAHHLVVGGHHARVGDGHERRAGPQSLPGGVGGPLRRRWWSTG